MKNINRFFGLTEENKNVLRQYIVDNKIICMEIPDGIPEDDDEHFPNELILVKPEILDDLKSSEIVNIENAFEVPFDDRFLNAKEYIKCDKVPGGFIDRYPEEIPVFIHCDNEPTFKGREGMFYRFTTTEGKPSISGIWDSWAEDTGHDDNGKEYKIVYREIEDPISDEAEDAYDWENPAEVLDLETGLPVEYYIID